MADIINAAKQLGVDQISFLPADVSSHAFNREVLWSSERQSEVLIDKSNIHLLEEISDYILENYETDFENHFIAESPQKFRNIAAYYSAIHRLNEFPSKNVMHPGYLQ